MEILVKNINSNYEKECGVSMKLESVPAKLISTFIVCVGGCVRSCMRAPKMMELISPSVKAEGAKVRNTWQAVHCVGP